jgi:hypothetical protein
MARLVGGLLKSALAAKALQIAKREMAKPENQRKAKDLLTKVARRRGHR